MKVALVQMDVQIGEPEVNYRKVERFLDEAMAQSPDVIIFPEMWNTGYALEQGDALRMRRSKDKSPLLLLR